MSPNEYRDLINYEYSKKQRVVFNNSSAVHAAIVMEKIFSETANMGTSESDENSENENVKHIRLYAKNLNGEISKNQNYIHNLFNYVGSVGAKLDVLIDCRPVKLHSVINAYSVINELSKDENSNVRLKVVKSQEKVSEVFNRHNIAKGHFCISSNDMGRFEFDNERHIAKITFHNNEGLLKLGKIFDECYRDPLICE